MSDDSRRQVIKKWSNGVRYGLEEIKRELARLSARAEALERRVTNGREEKGVVDKD